MYKIGAIGDRDSILGFSALGVEVAFADTSSEAIHALRQFAHDDFAVIYITEQLAQWMEAEIAVYKDRLTPAVILIPGKSGSLGIGLDAVRKSVERAVGADIISPVDGD